MNGKIAVLGAGAIGGSVAADLIDAGLDVVVIDQWPRHVEAMREEGLRVEMPDLDLRVPVRARHLCELASLGMKFDVVLLIVKSFDTRWACELIEPYLKGDGVFVGVQNSMNNETIASVIGRERVVGCCVELSAEIFTPGFIQRNTPRKGTWFAVGELDGSLTPRAEEVRALIAHVGVTELTPNIEGVKWTKLIANCMTMGPFGLLGLRNAEARELPGIIDVSVRLGKEAMAVGEALGHGVEPVFGLTADDFAGADDQVLVTAMKTLLAHVGPRSRTAPIQDHIKGRRSEMAYISGLVSRRAKELGVPSPCNDAVAEIARMIDDGEVRMGRANYDLLRTKIAEADRG